MKLYLPRLAVQAGGQEDLEPDPTPEAAKEETILVLEDDDEVRAYSVDSLRELGYRVIEAHDGSSALRLLERQPRVDLLFTDVVLPGGLTGAQVATQAKALRPTLKVLFTTGYARNAIIHHGRLDKGVQLIVKPFSFTDLAAKVRDVLDSSGLTAPRSLSGYPLFLNCFPPADEPGTLRSILQQPRRSMNQQQGGSLRDEELPRISRGSGGLDDILGGGVDPQRMYLYEGPPGSGKTTLALQFLREGVRNGEGVLYITLSETESELRLVAKRHGWSLDGITVFELVPPETILDPIQELTVLHPADMELSETIRLIFGQLEVLNPSRIVVDSLSELRLLAQSSLRYRRQVLALKHFFSGRRCTVVLLDDLTAHQNDLQLHSIAHGVVLLEQSAIDYGSERRRMRVVTMRGIQFKGGFHDFIIARGGLEIFPRLVAAEHLTRTSKATWSRAAIMNWTRCWVVDLSEARTLF
ncbi:KaiC/GvpD/RAD55 family RecA-like ATPase/CheY-like chemotaxis protein [Bradyrhizobium sp. GM6.1]